MSVYVDGQGRNRRGMKNKTQNERSLAAIEIPLIGREAVIAQWKRLRDALDVTEAMLSAMGVEVDGDGQIASQEFSKVTVNTALLDILKDGPLSIRSLMKEYRQRGGTALKQTVQATLSRCDSFVRTDYGWEIAEG